MSGDRLTRQELSWLLAQEARTAADTLRRGVTGLTLMPGPGPALGEVTSTFDALDDAMRTLASLNTLTTSSGTPPQSRRGRIDLAALLMELAPATRVAIEPGSGTEVFGDDGELRRMLQVLLSFGATAAGPATLEEATSPASVRREGDDVKVSVTLGPDSSATGATEQAWLNRMAVRYGGSLILEGGHVTLVIPADSTDEQRREVDDLRRELAAAQEQGEASARELAALFATRRASLPPVSFSPSRPPRVSEGAFPTAARLVAALARLEERGAGRLATLALLVRHLPYEAPASVGLDEVIESAIAGVRERARAKGVDLQTAPIGMTAVVRPQAASAVLRLLVEQAIEATPSGGHIDVTAQAERDGVSLTVSDEGPTLPEGRETFARLDPAAPHPRGGDVELFFADALTRHIGGALESQPHDGRTRLTASLPALATRD